MYIYLFIYLFDLAIFRIPELSRADCKGFDHWGRRTVRRIRSQYSGYWFLIVQAKDTIILVQAHSTDDATLVFSSAPLMSVRKNESELDLR